MSLIRLQPEIGGKLLEAAMVGYMIYQVVE